LVERYFSSYKIIIPKENKIDTFNTPNIDDYFLEVWVSARILEKVRTIKASRLYILCDKWWDDVVEEKGNEKNIIFTNIVVL
jgi:hypothetical protein